jgi:hypothetical protein
MNKSTVIDWILAQTDIDLINSVSSAIKDRKNTLSSKLKYRLTPGMNVNVIGTNKFTEGEVIKVNKTRAVIKVYINGRGTRYNVPFSMLSTKGKDNEETITRTDS